MCTAAALLPIAVQRRAQRQRISLHHHPSLAIFRVHLVATDREAAVRIARRTVMLPEHDAVGEHLHAVTGANVDPRAHAWIPRLGGGSVCPWRCHQIQPLSRSGSAMYLILDLAFSSHSVSRCRFGGRSCTILTPTVTFGCPLS